MAQLALPGIAHAPESVRTHGLQEAHTHPLVSSGKQADGGMSSHRVPAHESWAWPLLELRTGTSWPALVLDLDHPDAYERLCGHAADGDIPWPNWSVERLSSRHIHVCYTLARPVLRGARARQRPLQLYGRITEYLGQTLQADRGYAHVLTHNPTMHRPGFRTYWGETHPYTLAQLQAHVPRGWRMPPVAQTLTVPGRNCLLFRSALRWAGREQNRTHDVMDFLVRENTQLPYPLGDVELRGIARSVERYRKRWGANGWHQPAFLERQAHRGRRGGKASGKARRERHQARDADILQAIGDGMSMRAVARQFGLSEGAVRHIAKRADRCVTKPTQVDPRKRSEGAGKNISLSASDSERPGGDRGGPGEKEGAHVSTTSRPSTETERRIALSHQFRALQQEQAQPAAAHSAPMLTPQEEQSRKAEWRRILRAMAPDQFPTDQTDHA